MSTLAVELNGDGVHSIAVPDRFTTTTPFSIELANLGRATHVHLRPDDDLDPAVSIGAVNHYVEAEGRKRIHVSTAAVEEPVRGKLKVVTGYGSNTKYVEVRVDPPVETAPDEVVVDERFAEPPERTPPPPRSQRFLNALDRAIQRGGTPALVGVFLAVGLGLAVAFAVDSALVFVAVGVALAVTLGVVLLSML